MTELQPPYDAFARIGEDPGLVLAPKIAHLVADGHRILSQQPAPGVHLKVHSDADGIHARLAIEEGRRIEAPIHLCFGLFERFGVQAVDLDLSLGVNARATVWSHCLFTRPDAARHAMNARLELKPGAHLTYNEAHYHGLSGLIEVIPHVTVTVGRRAVYQSDFALVQGRVGKRDIDYEVRVGEDGVAELTRKVFGHLTDEIRIRDEEAVDPIVLGMLR